MTVYLWIFMLIRCILFKFLHVLQYTVLYQIGHDFLKFSLILFDADKKIRDKVVLL